MAASQRRTRRLKLLIGAGVIAACVGYLVYGGIQETLVYFVTPSELHAKGTSAYGKSLRLGGLVREGSWTKEPGTLFHTFELVDDSSAVKVAFRGIPPDLFGEGRGALVEGNYGPDGVFRGKTILAKHSEEYKAAEDHASKDSREIMYKSVIKGNQPQ
ncbi:MAG TPA: cytochrome c maturation protein CcmE [Candidatus Tectomicrobia bacterium]|nr:cytochrome c maturation protein CcmE [Candidatus Tectomicrobia bacterium]